MSDVYRIYGGELSPYSVKVRSYFRYKDIPHEWIVRSADKMEEFEKHAKLPLIPLVVTPEDEGIQDSTAIIERMEALFPEPSIHPADPALRFLSALVEEFGDEWALKWMFHLRWWREVDRKSGAERIARMQFPDLDDAALESAVAMISDRMVGRLGFVGSSEQNVPIIEPSYRRGLELFDAHLASRPYAFGARPSFGDLALWGQLYQLWSDPTAGGIMKGGFPNVTAYAERGLEPKSEGDFEAWDTLAPTMLPILGELVGAYFLPWATANAEAVEKGEETFTVELPGGSFTQGAQKFNAKTLAAVKAKYAATEDKSALDPILQQTGCLGRLA